MVEEFIEALSLALQEEGSKEAEQQLQAARDENPVDFFVIFLDILKNDQVPDLSKKLAMLLITQLFPQEPESGNENLAPFPSEVINEYLAVTFSWLQNEDEQYASISAGLYARIALQDLQAINEFSTVDFTSRHSKRKKILFSRHCRCSFKL